MMSHTRSMHRYADEEVAEECHVAVCGLQRIQHDPAPSPDWPFLNDDQRRIASEAVRMIRSGATPSAQAHHEWWFGEMTAAGWAQAAKYDPAARVHPNLVHWDDLPEGERDKDRMFLAVVRVMTLDT
jgi:RyR domain